MTIENDKYPNKADYEPNVDKNSRRINGELPLSDPAESNTTEVFRKNEEETAGENKKSAFGENKQK